MILLVLIFLIFNKVKIAIFIFLKIKVIAAFNRSKKPDFSIDTN
jgi:hypothetical protein